MFDTGVVHIIVAGYVVDHYCFMFDRGVVHIIVAGYIVDHYCLMFDRGVVHIIVAGYVVDHYCLETVMVNNITATAIRTTPLSILKQEWTTI
jgi:hypothetical protein